MSGVPDPLPGYHRDPPEYDDSWKQDRDEPTTVVVRSEWNIPLIATLLAFVMFGLPISLMLWTWWWPW